MLTERDLRGERNAPADEVGGEDDDDHAHPEDDDRTFRDLGPLAERESDDRRESSDRLCPADGDLAGGERAVPFSGWSLSLSTSARSFKTYVELATAAKAAAAAVTRTIKSGSPQR